MMQWWHVTPPIDAEFLVLVAAGRVVTRTGVGRFFVPVGDRWADVRKWLEEHQFACVMEGGT